MTSTAQKLPPLPAHSGDENDNVDGENTTKDSVLSYLSKCGLTPSEISMNDIDESSLALLAGLSHRHLAGGDADGDDPMEKITEEGCTRKVAAKTQAKQPRGNDRATTKVDHDDEDDDDEDDDDYDDDAATESAVIFSTSTRIKKSGSTCCAKRPSSPNETVGSGGGMGRRVASSSSFNDKDDETSVQKLYTEYTSLFGSIDANAKQDGTASSLHTSRVASASPPAKMRPAGANPSPQPSPQPNPFQNTTPTTNNTPVEDDIRLQNLEPWQQALFERQDRHEKALLQCQAKMDAIARLFVAVSEQRDDYVRGLENQSKHPTGGPPLRDNAPPSSSAPRPPRDGPAEARPRLRLLGALLRFPRAAYRYAAGTRIARLVALVRVEAERHPMPGGPNARFLDWNMIFKIFFVCFVFGARMGKDGVYKGGGGGGGGGGKMSDKSFSETLIVLWKMYRVHVFVLCALTTYMLQTGLGQFLHRIFVRENVVRRVWRNDDIARDDRAPTGDRPAAPNDGGAPHDDGLGDPLHLGNRNGAALRRGPLGPGAADGVGGGGGEIYRQFHRTFLAGAVARRHGAYDVPADGGGGGPAPIPNRNIHRIVDLVKDVVYLVGSIVLSLFPMWHPRVQVLPPHPLRDRAGVVENDAPHGNRRGLPNGRDGGAVQGNANAAGADGGGNGAVEGLPRDIGEDNN